MHCNQHKVENMTYFDPPQPPNDSGSKRDSSLDDSSTIPPAEDGPVSNSASQPGHFPQDDHLSDGMDDSRTIPPPAIPAENAPAWDNASQSWRYPQDDLLFDHMDNSRTIPPESGPAANSASQ